MKQYIFCYVAIIILTLVVDGGIAKSFGSDDSSSQLFKKRNKVEKNISPFDANYFKRGKKFHITVLFDIVDGRMVLSDKPSIIGFGQGPHHPTAGNFIVMSKTKEGEIIDKYLLKDPRIALASEGEGQHLKKIMKAKDIAIILPWNAKITTIEMGPIAEKTSSYDVEKKNQQAMEQAKRNKILE